MKYMLVIVAVSLIGCASFCPTVGTIPFKQEISLPDTGTVVNAKTGDVLFHYEIQFGKRVSDDNPLITSAASGDLSAGNAYMFELTIQSIAQGKIGLVYSEYVKHTLNFSTALCGLNESYDLRAPWYKRPAFDKYYEFEISDSASIALGKNIFMVLSNNPNSIQYKRIQ